MSSLTYESAASTILAPVAASRPRWTERVKDASFDEACTLLKIPRCTKMKRSSFMIATRVSIMPSALGPGEWRRRIQVQATTTRPPAHLIRRKARAEAQVPPVDDPSRFNGSLGGGNRVPGRAVARLLARRDRLPRFPPKTKPAWLHLSGEPKAKSNLGA